MKYNILNIYDILTYLLSIISIVPPVTSIAILIGTICKQKLITATGIQYISCDRASYRKKILWAYLTILMFFFLTEFIIQNFSEDSLEDMHYAFFALALFLAMGMIANYTAKRLRGMGYSHYWALLCAVPLVGPLMELWLAFTNRTKTLITAAAVFD